MIRYWRCFRLLRKFKRIDDLTLYRALVLYSRFDIEELESFIHLYDKVPQNRKKDFEAVIRAYSNPELLPIMDFSIKTFLMFDAKGIKVDDVQFFQDLVDRYIQNKELMDKFETQTLKNN